MSNVVYCVEQCGILCCNYQGSVDGLLWRADLGHIALFNDWWHL